MSPSDNEPGTFEIRMWWPLECGGAMSLFAKSDKGGLTSNDARRLSYILSRVEEFRADVGLALGGDVDSEHDGGIPGDD